MKKHIIGWHEHVDLPGWGIRDLKVKVDTGARTSAVHVENVEELPGNRVRFELLFDHRRGESMSITEKVCRRSSVRSSHGTRRERIFVVTSMRLGPVRRRIELGLANRKRMKFPMILGRSALRGKFRVDPVKSRTMSG